MAVPTVAGFTTFLRDVAQIPVLALPDNSVVIPTALQVALGVVNPQLAYISAPIIPGFISTPLSMYELAVYNFGADRVINYAPDVNGQKFFVPLRKKLDINLFVPGVIASTSSESTAQSQLNPDFMKRFTLRDLQNLKTPFGREYLAIAQDVGSLWGIS